MPVTSPNMGLIVPTPETAGVTGTGDAGPQYAVNVSNALNTIDAHDHSSGKGVLINPAGLNISADLPFQSNNATQIRAARFTSQATGLSLTGDFNELFVKLGDLWYINSGGTPVQVTSGAQVQSPGSPAVTDFIQIGATGAAPIAVATSTPTGSAGLVPWNWPFAQSGNVSQPTNLGTGAAMVNVAKAGLYQISYALQGCAASGASGWAGGAGPLTSAQAWAFQTLNATGTLGSSGVGTLIQQSMAELLHSGTGVPTATYQTAARTYVVQLAAGINIETWVQVGGGNPTGQMMAVQPTGSSFTMTRIA
jgi:hypothetical protein